MPTNGSSQIINLFRILKYFSILCGKTIMFYEYEIIRFLPNTTNLLIRDTRAIFLIYFKSDALTMCGK